jgi:hypothetical protein
MFRKLRRKKRNGETANGRIGESANGRVGETAKVDLVDVSVDVLKLPAAMAVSAPLRIRPFAHSPFRPFASGSLRRARRWRRGGSRQRNHRQTTIGFPGIASAVSTLRRILKIIFPIDCRDPVRSLEIPNEPISFRIHIRCDVVRDLSRCMA